MNVNVHITIESITALNKLKGESLYPIALVGTARSGKSYLGNVLVDYLVGNSAVNDGNSQNPTMSGVEQSISSRFKVSHLAGTHCTQGIDMIIIPRDPSQTNMLQMSSYSRMDHFQFIPPESDPGPGAMPSGRSHKSKGNGYWIIIDSPGCDLDDASDSFAICTTAICSILSQTLIYVDSDRLSLHALLGLSRMVVSNLQARHMIVKNECKSGSSQGKLWVDVGSPSENLKSTSGNESNNYFTEGPQLIVAVNRMILDPPDNSKDWLEGLLSISADSSVLSPSLPSHSQHQTTSNAWREAISAIFPYNNRDCVVIPYHSTEPNTQLGQKTSSQHPSYSEALRTIIIKALTAAGRNPTRDTNGTLLDGPAFRAVALAATQCVFENSRSLRESVATGTPWSASVPSLEQLYVSLCQNALEKSFSSIVIPVMRGDESLEDHDKWQECALQAGLHAFEGVSGDLFALRGASASLSKHFDAAREEIKKFVISKRQQLEEEVRHMREFVNISIEVAADYSSDCGTTLEAGVGQTVPHAETLQELIKSGMEFEVIPAVSSSTDHTHSSPTEKSLLMHGLLLPSLPLSPEAAGLDRFGRNRYGASLSFGWGLLPSLLIRNHWNIYDVCLLRNTYSWSVGRRRNGQQVNGPKALTAVELTAVFRFERRHKEITNFASALLFLATSTAIFPVTKAIMQQEHLKQLPGLAALATIPEPLFDSVTRVTQGATCALGGILITLSVAAVIKRLSRRDGKLSPLHNQLVREVIFSDPAVPPVRDDGQCHFFV